MENKFYLEVRDGVRTFGDSTVLEHVSIQVERGEICGLVGRNGSGKTMLLRCICGLVPLTSGTVWIGGSEVGQKKGSLPDIGALIETPGFLPGFSGYQNLKLLASLKKKIGREEIYGIMKEVGLDPESKKHVGKYSLGMCQRLGIAQAIMESPELILLDEPMNGLDEQGVADMRQLFWRLKEQGKTIVLATHVKEDVELLCDRIYRLRDGRVMESESKL